MEMELLIEAQDASISQRDVDALLERLRQSFPSTQFSLAGVQKPWRPGELKFDYAGIWNLITHTARAGALGVIAADVFKIVLEWQKQRAQKIKVKVGQVDMEFPANASLEQLARFAKKIARIERSQAPARLDKPSSRKPKTNGTTKKS